MNKTFTEKLRQLRTEKKLSQQQLADQLFVDRSSVASWETGRRMPDAALLLRIAECLDVDVGDLLNAAETSADRSHVILVDDESIILRGTLPLLKSVLPDADIQGFLRPSDAIKFAESCPVSLAFLDIELGKANGLDLCRKLLRIHPDTRVIFLTSYIDYSFRAWDTGASGFLLKPLTVEKIRKQLSLLRYPAGRIS